jgi:hypothetical protein
MFPVGRKVKTEIPVRGRELFPDDAAGCAVGEEWKAKPEILVF